MGQAWQTFKTAFLAFAGAYVGWKTCEYLDENSEEIKNSAQDLWADLKARASKSESKDKS